MRVIDFFCGAGGFSEGFRLAGFDVIWAIDKWKPAVLTHQKNHPSSNSILDDVERIAFLPDEEFEQVVPDSEIIIGSPPCIAFSNSNRSGKADKSKGIRLINSYLRIVARKKFKKDSILKYWILENVPNSQNYIKNDYCAKDLQLAGDFILHVKTTASHIYNAQYYGVPSKRKRFICGDFPEPERTILTDEKLIPLSKILSNLGLPKKKPDDSIIYDPNYAFFLESNLVTDHHYIQEVAQFEWEKAKRLKQDKGYMGRMSFPESINKPARTVMATMSFSSRESMIFGYKNDRYRAPTIREIACLMSFPIDYNFYGDSISIKYKLVGNAVPPKLSYSIAKAIAEKEDVNIRSDYSPIGTIGDSNFTNLNWKKIPLRQETKKNPRSKFRYHIPYLIENTYRVELSNHSSDFKNGKYIWNVELHRSQGPNAKKFILNLDSQLFSESENAIIQEYLLLTKHKLTNEEDFQASYCMTRNERESAQKLGPYELLNDLKIFIDQFSKEFDCTKSIEHNNEPYLLPKKIAVGYFILNSVLKNMEGK